MPAPIQIAPRMPTVRHFRAAHRRKAVAQSGFHRGSAQCRGPDEEGEELPSSSDRGTLGSARKGRRAPTITTASASPYAIAWTTKVRSKVAAMYIAGHTASHSSRPAMSTTTTKPSEYQGYAGVATSSALARPCCNSLTSETSRCSSVSSPALPCSLMPSASSATARRGVLPARRRTRPQIDRPRMTRGGSPVSPCRSAWAD